MSQKCPIMHEQTVKEPHTDMHLLVMSLDLTRLRTCRLRAVSLGCVFCKFVTLVQIVEGDHNMDKMKKGPRQVICCFSVSPIYQNHVHCRPSVYYYHH